MRGTAMRSTAVIASSERLIIRSSSSYPVAYQLLHVGGQERSPLRHPVAGDSGSGDFPVEIAVGRIERLNPGRTRRLDARLADDVRIGASGCERQLLLSSEAAMATDGGAVDGEDLV